jgi:YVTN family beta-propeller protein
MKPTLFFAFALFCCMACQEKSVQQWIAEAPAGNAYTAIDAQGVTVLPNGRLIKPYGKTYRIAPHPYGLILSADGKIAITANSGTGPFSITLIKEVLGNNPVLQQIPEGADNDKDLLGAVFMGLAISPDQSTVYVAGGQANQIYLFDIATGKPKGSIPCAYQENGQDFSHGYIGDMALTKDGKTLLAVDQIGFRLLVIDTETREIRHRVPTGRYPFGVTLSPNEKKAFVANVGMFEYGALQHPDGSQATLPYPPFAYGSEQMKSGTTIQGVQVPGLGEPNAPESFSVWTVSLDSPTPTVTAKVKTGILVGEVLEDFPAVGGASPNSVVATNELLFVSNGNNDCITVIDLATDSLVNQVFLNPDPRLGNLRGIIPFGVALSPDQQRLFVAESGINAVAVIDVPTQKVMGHIPVGWFPSKLQVSPDGKKLVVANAKGYGSGPNGGKDFVAGPEGSNIGKLMKGSLTVMDIPSDKELATLTKQVVDNNYRFVDPSTLKNKSNNPVPLYAGQGPSPIQYIVFVSKENRTYDEVFGQLPQGKGDPSLARYGAGVTFSNRRKTATVDNAVVMPNHLLLARQFAIADNFYCDSDHSADGHRWLVNTYPNEWVETSVAAAYGGRRGMAEGSVAPGNLALVGSSGAIYPEDYNEAGSMWEHLDRHGIDFFNFGFGLEMAATLSDSTMKYMGVTYQANYPVPAPIFEKSSKKYATYNMAIPDQFRLATFMEEFNERWTGPGKTLPSVLTIILPNDHGAGERPEAGFPFKESYMADNDLALGRLVEFLSHTPYWKNMAIVVTEDDSQDGKDHVDAHRSLLMVISPYAKKDYVGHVHYSFGSIFKTFWHILGLPYLNQYDATATDLADLFTSEPDFSPYRAVPVDARFFDPAKALTPMDTGFDWKAMFESPVLDDPGYLLRTRLDEDARN